MTNHRNVELRQGTLEYDDLDFEHARWGYSDTHGLPIVPTIGVEVTR